MFLRARIRACFSVTAYLSTLCAVVACERSDAFRTGDAEIRYDPQFGAPEEDHRLPLVSCVDSFSSKRKLSLAARLEPDEVVLAGKPSWTPVDIVDAAALDSGFVILDRGAAEVTLVSNELQVLRTWGRRGGGPGEFQAPAAVTVDQSGDTIWVLDAAPPAWWASTDWDGYNETFAFLSWGSMSPQTHMGISTLRNGRCSQDRANPVQPRCRWSRCSVVMEHR